MLEKLKFVEYSEFAQRAAQLQQFLGVVQSGRRAPSEVSCDHDSGRQQQARQAASPGQEFALRPAFVLRGRGNVDDLDQGAFVALAHTGEFVLLG